jgi:serine protease Do
LKVKQGDNILDLPNIQLSGPPPSQPLAFLGILPMRDDADPGVEVRYVYPKSPAEQAGLKPGDRIVRLEKVPLYDRNQLMQRFSTLAPGVEIGLEVRRKEGEKTETVTVKLAEIPETVPEELPPGTHKKALARRKPMTPPRQPGKPMPPRKEKPPPAPPEEKPKEVARGFFTKTDETSGRAYWAYVPEDYDPNISYALVVWLHPIGDPMEPAIRRLWPELCQKHHLILLAPKAENPSGWLTSEADFIKADIRALLQDYTIDRQRVVVHGLGNGADLALYLAFDARDLVRGVAAVGGVLSQPPKENAADQRLAFFLIGGAKDPVIEGIRATPQKLSEKHFPVRYREIADHGNGYVSDAELLQELARWIDALDRI